MRVFSMPVVENPPMTGLDAGSVTGEVPDSPMNIGFLHSRPRRRMFSAAAALSSWPQPPLRLDLVPAGI
jgi:hypothetical protein